MLTTFRTLAELQLRRQQIESLFFREWKIYSHHYASLEATLSIENNNGFTVFFDEEADVLLAFEKFNNDAYQSAISGFPILGLHKNTKTQVERTLSAVAKSLGCSTLYFPLVYAIDELPQICAGLSGIVSWQRLPSPIIRGSVSNEEILAHVQKRYGSRFQRQKKKFEQALTLREVTGKEVETVLAQVESRSWKSHSQQDMLSRGYQFAYYAKLIQSGCARMTAAYDQHRPVAFRIDSQVKDVLYLIKWSFDEEYKKYSPGFYLLTFSLLTTYDLRQLQYIDLYGSPDSLKDLLETDRLERVDLCFSLERDHHAAEVIKNNKLRFDAKLHENYSQKKSIRQAFINSHDSKTK